MAAFEGTPDYFSESEHGGTGAGTPERFPDGSSATLSVSEKARVMRGRLSRPQVADNAPYSEVPELVRQREELARNTNDYDKETDYDG